MTHHVRNHVVSACLLLSLAGCAGVTAVPAPPGSTVQGIRIYEQKPILIVSGQKVEVGFVPNTSRAYALQFYSFLAKHDLTASFSSSGTLSSLTSNQDTTGVAIALLNLVNKAVKEGGGLPSAFSGTTASTLNERVQVYDFVFDDNGELIQLRPLIRQSDLLRMPRQRESQAFPGTAPGTTGQMPAGRIDGQPVPATQQVN
jgi:hypothetical protein